VSYETIGVCVISHDSFIRVSKHIEVRKNVDLSCFILQFVVTLTGGFRITMERGVSRFTTDFVI